MESAPVMWKRCTLPGWKTHGVFTRSAPAFHVSWEGSCWGGWQEEGLRRTSHDLSPCVLCGEKGEASCFLTDQSMCESIPLDGP